MVKNKLKSSIRKIKCTLCMLVLFLPTLLVAQTPFPDPDRGLRADWMRGSLGVLWLPENNYNGNIEGVTMDDFIAQTSHLKTLDFVQIALASPYTYSPVHTAPHPIIESLWEGDTDVNGKPVNLVVPRSTVADPFLGWLESIRGAGLKTEVYVNSSNLLQWIGEDSPTEFAEVSNRWKAFCDTDPAVQAFIKSKDYHTDGVHDDRRPYMFAYAEFILKDYAVRYGDLIDAWCFDAAHVNMRGAGDEPDNQDLDQQRIYQAFADAVHAGNADASVTFNNGIGDRDSDPFQPYATPSLFEDYKFGHPFGGAGNMVEPRDPLYTVNFGICEYMRDTNGLPYVNDGIDGNDNVVAHFFPKQSTTSWNAGSTPCLTDAEFVEWNNVGLINGGGITWGTPLVITNLNNSSSNLILQPYALNQLELVDADLSVNQYLGAPNWARTYTILPAAYLGESYSHTLVEGTDFWDPEGDAIVSLLAQGNAPDWLTITETETGVWTLSGTPTEAIPTDYDFNLQVNDATAGTERVVTLQVIDNGAPTWVGQETILPDAIIGEAYTTELTVGTNFIDPDGDDIVSLEIVNTNDAPSWLTITSTVAGTWILSGMPSESIPTDYQFDLLVSDAASGSSRTVELRVSEYEISNTMYVEVKATANTNYGIGEVATMFSELMTAPDGLATFKVSIDVTPMADLGVFSGTSGGPSTENSWGLGNGTGGIQDNLFGGSDNEWTESIGNIQIIEFNDNGGVLTAEDIISSVFKSITIVNGQSGNDAVSFKIGDVITDFGKTSAQTDAIDMEAAMGVDNIIVFALGTGNTAATNKWSVEGLTLLVEFDENTLSVSDAEVSPLNTFKLFPNPASERVSFNKPLSSATIFDMSGRIVKKFNEAIQDVNVSNFTSGIYFLKGITNEGGVITTKFIKK